MNIIKIHNYIIENALQSVQIWLIALSHEIKTCYNAHKFLCSQTTDDIVPELRLGGD